jgi:hypothetical protein
MFLTDTPTHLMLDRAKPGSDARNDFVSYRRNIRRDFRIKSRHRKIYLTPDEQPDPVVIGPSPSRRRGENR